MEQVLVAWNVVTDYVASLPATEKREARSEVQFHGVFSQSSVRCRDVSDFVSVVDVGGGSWENSVEALDAGLAGFRLSGILVSVDLKFTSLITFLEKNQGGHFFF